MCFKSKPENSFSINQHLDCYSITLSLHEDHGGRSEIMKEKWIKHIKVIWENGWRPHMNHAHTSQTEKPE